MLYFDPMVEAAVLAARPRTWLVRQLELANMVLLQCLLHISRKPMKIDRPDLAVVICGYWIR
jgi:hypothetical protein